MPAPCVTRTTHRAKVGLATLAWVLSFYSQAQSCAPIGPEASAEDLQEQVANCQNDSNWLAMAGSLLNQKRRYREAADFLERALLFAPDLPQVQLDYIIALAGLGDFASAAAFAEALLAQPDQPQSLREPLMQQLAQWQAATVQKSAGQAVTQAGWRTDASIALRLGYDTNILGSPNLGSLAITLGNQTLELLLDETYRAREAGYLRTDAHLALSHQAPEGGQWRLTARLLARNSPDLPQARIQQYDISAERSRVPGREPSPYLTIAASGFDSGTGSHYNAQGLATGLDWALGRESLGQFGHQCQLRLGLELSWRRHLAETLLSGLYRGASTNWVCESPSGGQWRLTAKAGQDNAQDQQRAGGDQTQASLRLTHQHGLQLWGKPAVLLSEVDVAASRDAQGYSPLLGNGAVRSMQRATVRLELQHSLLGGWHWLAGFELSQQQSNIALIGLSNWGPYTSLGRRW